MSRKSKHRKLMKKKMGRPLASPEPRGELCALRLNSTEFDCLNTYAWRYDQSVSDVIRQALMILSIIPES